MGNGLRFRITRNDGHKPKTRKENQIMKNRNIQFKPTAGLLIPLLLACFAAVFISAPNSALARDQVPFNGIVSGFVETSEFLPPCTIHAHASNFGNATHLGAFTGSGELFQDFCEDPPNITYTGTSHWFAANGDELSSTFEGFLSPTETPGVYDNHETCGRDRRHRSLRQRHRPYGVGRANRHHRGAAVFCPPLSWVDLKCRLEQALEIVRLICASQLAFVWLRCARSTKKPATS